METIVYPVLGGAVEQCEAMEFTGQDQQTGAPRQVQLPNRIVVTHGRKKCTLDGSQVIALVEVYSDNQAFRDWCEQCK